MIGVLVVAMIVFGNIGVQVIVLPLIVALVGLLGLGVGLFVAVANTHYRDVQYLVGIALNALFFLVPIVYPLTLIPEGDQWGLPIRRIIELNPIYSYIAAIRDAVYFVEWPSAGRWLVMLITSSVVFVSGWRFFAKRSMDLSEEM